MINRKGGELNLKKVFNIFILCVTFLNAFVVALYCSPIVDITPILNIAKDYRKDEEAAKSKWIGREIYVKESVRELGVWDKEYANFEIKEGDAYGSFVGEMQMLYKRGFACIFVFDGVPDEALEMQTYDYVEVKGTVKSVFVDENRFIVVLIHSKVISNLARR